MSEIRITKSEQTLSRTSSNAEAQNAPQKINSVFSVSDILQAAQKENFSEEDINTFKNLVYKFDTENVKGNEQEKDGMLNIKEQANFLEMLQEKFPKLFTFADNLLKKSNSKSDIEKLAYNLGLLGNFGNGVITQELSIECLDNLTCDNILPVARKYHGVTLLLGIYEDLCYIPDITENTTDEEKLKIEQDTKNRQKLKDKSEMFAKYLLDFAEKNGIYSKDYKKELDKTKENNDLKNYIIATQRLADRIVIATDKNKEKGSSKRAIELKDPNGKLDGMFVQGYTGDCWFLSALNSICTNKNMLDKLNSMINVNKDGDVIKSVNVNIQGKDYTIDYEELRNANEYSTGDLDARAIEIAVNRYMHENNILSGDISLGGNSADAYKILFGEDNLDTHRYAWDTDEEDSFAELFPEIEFENNNNIEQAVEYLNAIKNDKELISTLGIEPNKQQKVYGFNENNEKVEIPTTHAYIYSRIDDVYVYFKDPRFPNIELHISIDDFPNIFDTAFTSKLKEN